MRNSATPEGGTPADVHTFLADLVRAQWKRCRRSVKSCRKRFSEKPVHASRIAARRLLATMELLDRLLDCGGIEKIRRSLKRTLGTFAQLRDAQVQLALASAGFPATGDAAAFLDFLLNREAQARKETRRRVRQFKLRRLGTLIQDLETHLRCAAGRRNPSDLAAVTRCVQRAHSKTTRLRRDIDPANPITIHRTRVAFKKFRYLVEALTPVLPHFSNAQLAALQKYQAMMGDIQDVTTLRESYEHFTKKRDRDSRTADELRQELMLRQRRLIQRYLKAANKLAGFWPRPKPSARPRARQP